MKNIILLVVLVELYLQDISCDNILSKFHQNSYKIRDVRLEVANYTEKFFNKFEFKTFKYNRTSPAINGTVNFIITVRVEQLEILVQGYKFLSNEYRYAAVRFQINLKKAANSNAIGLRAINKCGNIKTDTITIFEKDVTYYICNFIIDETQFPPLIPSGSYKIEETLLYLNEAIATVCGYGEIYTPIAYPKD